MTKSEDTAIKIIAQNKRARFDYHIIETFEAGIVLTGAEIKSVRQGHITLTQSFVFPEASELFLTGAHIKPYEFNSDQYYDPTRKRKLLLHRREIDKLSAQVEAKGFTIVPLKIYLKRGRAKVEIALAKGKAAPDKRESTKAREADREMARAVRGTKR